LLRAEKNEQMALRLKEEAEKKEKNARAELENLLKGANINASAERMNIVYIGLDNPVTISVPGFRCEDIEASISHGKLTKTSDCKYVIRVSNREIKNNQELKISVQAKTKDGGNLRTVNRPFEFRAKDIPLPSIAFCGNFENDFYLPLEKFLNANLPIPIIPNFDYDVDVHLLSFYMVLSGQPKEASIEFNGLSNREEFGRNIKNLISEARWEDAEIVEEDEKTGRIYRKNIKRITVSIEGAAIEQKGGRTRIAQTLKFFVYKPRQ
jgi:hypothetical protein